MGVFWQRDIKKLINLCVAGAKTEADFASFLQGIARKKGNINFVKQTLTDVLSLKGAEMRLMSNQPTYKLDDAHTWQGMLEQQKARIEKCLELLKPYIGS